MIILSMITSRYFNSKTQNLGSATSARTPTTTTSSRRCRPKKKKRKTKRQTCHRAADRSRRIKLLRINTTRRPSSRAKAVRVAPERNGRDFPTALFREKRPWSFSTKFMKINDICLSLKSLLIHLPYNQTYETCIWFGHC